MSDPAVLLLHSNGRIDRYFRVSTLAQSLNMRPDEIIDIANSDSRLINPKLAVCIVNDLEGDYDICK